jgi:hypothetical protein
MTRIIADISVSLDGFVTGPTPTRSVIPASIATHLSYDVSR